MDGGESRFRAWDALFPDLLGLIFKNLSLQEVLQVIPRVCKPWCRVVEGPYCWERIDIVSWSSEHKPTPESRDRMLRMLVARSSGSLRELKASHVTDDQMLFIAEHGGSLETLRLTSSAISNLMMEQAATKLTSLTTLDISYCNKFSMSALECIKTYCKKLASLDLDEHAEFVYTYEEEYLHSREDEVWGIAGTMPKLKHLSVAYLNIDTAVAPDIFRGCPELKSKFKPFRVEGCWDVHFSGNLLEETDPKVNVVAPDDCFHAYPDKLMESPQTTMNWKQAFACDY